MDNPKRARSEKPRKQPRECAYVRSPDLQSALERIRRVPAGIKEHGSQRSGIMSTTSTASGRPTLASSGMLHRE